jgi:hypothetical protein
MAGTARSGKLAVIGDELAEVSHICTHRNRCEATGDQEARKRREAFVRETTRALGQPGTHVQLQDAIRAAWDEGYLVRTMELTSSPP